ncbi:Rossmann-fold NAD(P)-binding domain-containing protein [Streptomyces zaomyceticus]|uniref:hypothetical protein n=1 Tax=Streptomyces zaomyceticus TaxID=68286 RepID=UPI00167A5D69|nr:hypothetical protein [Streptomyces zaomyceticus]GHG15780.1 hypothetical protein GCM10018791_32850 [Streptomyces zaomyceticus]
MGAAHHAVDGLASNPAAPADVLLRLLALDDGDDWIARRLSWRTSLPDSVAEAMLHHPRRRVRALLAESAAADPELRARLLDGPASDAVLVAVGPTPYRTQAPPLPDRAYERLLNHERGMVRHETVESASVPVHVLVPLAGHEDPLFRLAACRRVWSRLADDVRAALLADADPAVRTAASLQVMHEDEERTAELVGTLAEDWRLGEVLERGRLGRALAERLLTEGARLAQLARNPSLPTDLAAGLAAHEDPAVRLAVSARPELSEEERAAIDWAVDPEDRLDTLRWVWDAREDADVLRRCATSAHTWLRRSAAVCPALPRDCVELLAGDADFAVRLLLAEYHPLAPPELLLDLYLNGSHRAVAMLTTRPRFPAEGLAARFADAPEPEARALALRDPGATPALVERLSRDPAGRVREAAALDRRLPVARLVELLEDPNVGSAAACNRALPVSEMRALLDRAGVPGL